MGQILTFDRGALDGLARGPLDAVKGQLNGSRFEARIAIPYYADHIAKHYGVTLGEVGVPLDFAHFGFVLTFDRPTEIFIHDDDRLLDEGLRDIVRRFGTVILRNAYLEDAKREAGQRNIFPSLRFHFDRGANQREQVSLFYRDPFDPEQKEPRKSSTLIAANVVVYLQSLKEGANAHQFGSQYEIFKDEDIATLDGDILLRQAWREPTGTGEICIINNRTVLHASYYEREGGYRISVRYLA
jgi:hypothetical protein